ENPAEERVGFILEPDATQRGRRERRVPDPGIAIVPVAYAAHRSRQGGGRGCRQRAVDPVVAELQGNRCPPDHRLLGAVITGSRHPTAPGVGGFAKLDVDIEAVMAMKTTPRKHEVEPVSLAELVATLQTGQRTVGAKVQTKLASRQSLHFEPGKRRA